MVAGDDGDERSHLRQSTISYRWRSLRVRSDRFFILLMKSLIIIKWQGI